jgi:hypothetical protein
MKKRSLIAALIVLLCGTSLSAKSFDWSQCWCNYGGGIEKGDFIVNVDAGLLYSDFVYNVYDGYWCLPPIMVEVQYAQPIWKLPFTFGGYAGIHAYGYKYLDHYDIVNRHYVYETDTYWGLFFGGEAAYHVQLPPESLDVYAVTRIGANIPVVKPNQVSGFQITSSLVKQLVLTGSSVNHLD